MIHCGESALWGKSVRPSWSLWGTYTHKYKWYIVGKVHCGENMCVVVAVVRKSSFPHNANFIFPHFPTLCCCCVSSQSRSVTLCPVYRAACVVWWLYVMLLLCFLAVTFRHAMSGVSCSLCYSVVWWLYVMPLLCFLAVTFRHAMLCYSPVVTSELTFLFHSHVLTTLLGKSVRGLMMFLMRSYDE